MITDINRRLEKIELLTTTIFDTPEKSHSSTSIIHRGRNVFVLAQDLETLDYEDSSETSHNSISETSKAKNLEVNEIQPWKQPTKLFYHRPTLPDMVIEERPSIRQNH